MHHAQKEKGELHCEYSRIPSKGDSETVRSASRDGAGTAQEIQALIGGGNYPVEREDWHLRSQSHVKEDPRYYVVSVRVTNQEKELLDSISRNTNKTISDIIRDAMQLSTPKHGTYHDKEARVRTP